MKLEKECKVCKQVKLIENFPKRGNHRLNSCADCYNKRQRELWKKRYDGNPEFRKLQIEESRRARWKYEYGVSYEDVYTALAEQNGKCANTACGKEITLDPFENIIKRANVDHNHETGKFRALLCNSCNTLLGRIEKDVSIIYGLIDYAKLHSYQ